jgi:glycosyltransferase involved in cell wall biosynthesis
MRIAVVTTSYPAFLGDPCGHFVETHTRTLAQLDDVVVVAPETGGVRPVGRERSSGSLTVIRLAGGNAFGWPGVVSRIRCRPYRIVGAARWAVLARHALASLAPLDRIVAHWAFPCGWPIAHDLGVPLELVSHGQDVRSLVQLPSPIRRHVLRALFRHAETWTFVSSSLHAALARMLEPEDRKRLDAVARIEPCSIEIPDVADAIRARRAARSDARLFVCVARLVPSKRVDRVVDHVARECASVCRARLVVVGDGPLRARLERQARSAGLDAVFVGRTTREVTLAWIGSADAVLHASEAEGLSTVEREAQALGVPFLSVA